MQFLIVTSINPPTKSTVELARGALSHGYKFIVIGDKKSGPDYNLAGADFYSLQQQYELPFEFARACPTGHYARKNIGYLIAIKGGASEIVETDDDNVPTPAFWSPRLPHMPVKVCDQEGWVNLYSYFSDNIIWPRGYPLDLVRRKQPSIESFATRELLCPIHQGLADANPDVDAVYRLLFDLPFTFNRGPSIAITGKSVCPFNSQNTRWWKPAFPLLYLPFNCSFRMTDIWRSFIAQRILAAKGMGVLFHEASVYQERNEHDLMRDFSEEIEGYCNNAKIIQALQVLPLGNSILTIHDDMRLCYEVLIDFGLVHADELSLLDAWRSDLTRLSIS